MKTYSGNLKRMQKNVYKFLFGWRCITRNSQLMQRNVNIPNGRYFFGNVMNVRIQYNYYWRKNELTEFRNWNLNLVVGKVVQHIQVFIIFWSDIKTDRKSKKAWFAPTREYWKDAYITSHADLGEVLELTSSP